MTVPSDQLVPPAIRLDDSDRNFMRQCPRRLLMQRGSRVSRDDAAKLKRLQRLLDARLVKGTIDVEASSRDFQMFDITLTDEGRVALGLLPAVVAKP